MWCIGVAHMRHYFVSVKVWNKIYTFVSWVEINLKVNTCNTVLSTHLQSRFGFYYHGLQ